VISRLSRGTGYLHVADDANGYKRDRDRDRTDGGDKSELR
jgi:hypothetical protein